MINTLLLSVITLILLDEMLERKNVKYRLSQSWQRTKKRMRKILIYLEIIR